MKLEKFDYDKWKAGAKPFRADETPVHGLTDMRKYGAASSCALVAIVVNAVRYWDINGNSNCVGEQGRLMLEAPEPKQRTIWLHSSLNSNAVTAGMLPLPPQFSQGSWSSQELTQEFRDGKWIVIQVNSSKSEE